MFSKVFKRGRYSSGYFLTVYALKNYNRNAPFRLGVSVSAKNGGAVKRNRAKRVIREAFYSICRNRKISDGYFIVIIGRAPCFDRRNKTQSVLKCMEKSMLKLNLID
ncbi:MAG: ribonuclease P protein component [Oscillospiraceae bacterium]|nr:ribonuclease P protein component [Oscillospiraceae bacterium]